MYIRRTTVKRCNRSYLAIAHNIWKSRSNGCGQSRPIVLANLGAEAHVDVAFVREVIVALEGCTTLQATRSEGSCEATRRVAEKVRMIEPFLRVLVSRRAGISNCLPQGSGRIQQLEHLIREQLDSPSESGDDFDAVLSGFRASRLDMFRSGEIAAAE